MDKTNEAAAELLARNLQGGAGAAHRIANADNARQPLRLTLVETNEEGGNRPMHHLYGRWLPHQYVQ